MKPLKPPTYHNWTETGRWELLLTGMALCVLFMLIGLKAD